MYSAKSNFLAVPNFIFHICISRNENFVGLRVPDLAILTNTMNPSPYLFTVLGWLEIKLLWSSIKPEPTLMKSLMYTLQVCVKWTLYTPWVCRELVFSYGERGKGVAGEEGIQGRLWKWRELIMGSGGYSRPEYVSPPSIGIRLESGAPANLEFQESLLLSCSSQEVLGLDPSACCSPCLQTPASRCQTTVGTQSPWKSSARPCSAQLSRPA